MREATSSQGASGHTGVIVAHGVATAQQRHVVTAPTAASTSAHRSASSVTSSRSAGGVSDRGERARRRRNARSPSPRRRRPSPHDPRPRASRLPSLRPSLREGAPRSDEVLELVQRVAEPAERTAALQRPLEEIGGTAVADRRRERDHVVVGGARAVRLDGHEATVLGLVIVAELGGDPLRDAQLDLAGRRVVPPGRVPVAVVERLGDASHVDHVERSLSRRPSHDAIMRFSTDGRSQAAPGPSGCPVR